MWHLGRIGRSVPRFDTLESSRVLLTGHTGFKGTWLSRILDHLGAEVFGISLEPEKGSLFTKIPELNFARSEYFDLADNDRVKSVLQEVQPELVIHMAAQPLVRRSYRSPILTFHTNVMGTAHVLEAARHTQSVHGVLVVTSDKVYRNLETDRGYKEEDSLGGTDPYSASKAAAEMVVMAWRNIFGIESNRKIVSARSGNIIGGGDHSEDRLLPDLIRSFEANEVAQIRNPKALRPWQHVLDPLFGYLEIADQILAGTLKHDAYNFGPDETSKVNVGELADLACRAWGDGAAWETTIDSDEMPETKLLWLDSSRARTKLNWNCFLNTEEAIVWTIDWEKRAKEIGAASAVDVQINKYLELL